VVVVVCVLVFCGLLSLALIRTDLPSFPPSCWVAIADVLLRSAQDRDAISAGVGQQRQGAFESIVWVDTGAAVGLA